MSREITVKGVAITIGGIIAVAGVGFIGVCMYRGAQDRKLMKEWETMQTNIANKSSRVGDTINA